MSTTLRILAMHGPLGCHSNVRGLELFNEFHKLLVELSELTRLVHTIRETYLVYPPFTFPWTYLKSSQVFSIPGHPSQLWPGGQESNGRISRIKKPLGLNVYLQRLIFHATSCTQARDHRQVISGFMETTFTIQNKVWLMVKPHVLPFGGPDSK